MPKEIIDEWKKGGVSRERLTQKFKECGFEKDISGRVVVADLFYY